MAGTCVGGGDGTTEGGSSGAGFAGIEAAGSDGADCSGAALPQAVRIKNKKIPTPIMGSIFRGGEILLFTKQVSVEFEAMTGMVVAGLRVILAGRV